MPRRALALTLLLAACSKGGEPAATRRDADAAVADDRPWLARWDEAAIAPRFAELRDADSLRCLLALGEDVWDVLPAIAEDAPVLVTRIAAFAPVEAARPDGESPTLDALMQAVHLLGPIDDLEGLLLALAEIDRASVQKRWISDDATYRARFGLSVPAVERDRDLLAVIRETALGADLTTAAQIYDHELTPIEIDSKYRRPTQVGALVALGRIDATRAVIAQAPAEERVGLAVAWLHTAIRMRAGVEVAVAAVIAEDAHRDVATHPPDTLWEALRAARRAGLAAELVPLRDWLVTHLGPDDAAALFDDAVLRGDHALRARLDPILDPADRQRVLAIHDGPLDDALAWVIQEEAEPAMFARLWVRHVVEGATPAFEATLAAKLCGSDHAVAPSPPLPQTPDTRLTMTTSHPRRLRACKGSDVMLTVTGKDPADADEEELEGSCEGRLFEGSRPGRVDHVGGRDVALVIGLHVPEGGDSEHQRFQIAIERCERIFVSKTFAAPYYQRFALDELSVVLAPDGDALHVVANSPVWRGVVYRLWLPSSCDEYPSEDVLESGY